MYVVHVYNYVYTYFRKHEIINNNNALTNNLASTVLASTVRVRVRVHSNTFEGTFESTMYGRYLRSFVKGACTFPKVSVEGGSGLVEGAIANKRNTTPSQRL